MKKVLFLIAMRNLVAHKAKALIVGSIIGFGTFTVVLGTAMLDSVDRSMSRSITQSLAGHLQVYSADARDELALFGGGFMGGDDYGVMREFGAIREAIEALPEVEAVVPMGLQMSTVMMGNEIDNALGQLREAVESSNDAAIASGLEQVQSMAADLIIEKQKTLAIAADTADVRDNLEHLKTVTDPKFPGRLRADPEQTLAFLDSKIAPLATEGALLYFRTLGTDLGRFTDLFDRFEIVAGETVPKGKTGFLFAHRVYEEMVKHKIARELDRIKESRDVQGKTIAQDPKLRDRTRRLPRQYRRISYQLSPENSQKLKRELHAHLGETEGDLKDLLGRFLTLTDDNFETRYGFFYEVIAPMIRLHLIPVGGEITLRSVTKTGYFKAVNVKVYGTYRFKGLEESDLAGAQNLVDIITFRELYGVMTAERQKELEDIRNEVGVADVARDDAEDALFGSGADTTAIADEEQAFDELKEIEREEYSASSTGFSQDDIDEGLAINAAVLLKNAETLPQTQARIEALSKEKSLGLKVVDWQTASGMVGQFIVVLRIVLYVAIFIIFAVALVIINNSMVMATMERVAEIGTMRAIGAQRSLIMQMFMVETMVLGVIAGLLGAAGAFALIGYWGSAGLPATSDILVFLFSGPRLYPTAGVTHLVLGIVVILVVSLISTLYPAMVATGIQPATAMQPSE